MNHSARQVYTTRSAVQHSTVQALASQCGWTLTEFAPFVAAFMIISLLPDQARS